MTKEQCIEMLPIMMAFAAGETVEIYDLYRKIWIQVDNIRFGAPPEMYRILTQQGKYIYFDNKKKT